MEGSLSRATRALMKCPHCGGDIIGDGYTTPRGCESADVPLDLEPDAEIVLCDPDEE